MLLDMLPELLDILPELLDILPELLDMLPELLDILPVLLVAPPEPLDMLEGEPLEELFMEEGALPERPEELLP